MSAFEIRDAFPMPDRPGRDRVWWCVPCGHKWRSRYEPDECPSCGAPDNCDDVIGSDDDLCDVIQLWERDE